SDVTASAPAVPKGKSITAYTLCRQNFERAHPGVDKKSMTVLFRAHWKQMGKEARKEWEEKARLAKASQVQVRPFFIQMSSSSQHTLQAAQAISST
ncbi:uncharacterized protein SCHCODRAFT_02519915, partial [Schizophyllum commune H4-8]|uniref:uncharacterized protein n=1 Tax=Schizophyllum commune (strain H4-8 / FGSC 9210) TaxID=578458 RepID=UPI002160BC3B